MTTRTADTPFICGWSTDLCCSPLETLFSSGDATEIALAQRCLNTAAEVLYALSGRQFGLCTYTVRPCRIDCCNPCDMTGPRWIPVLSGGQWTNVSCRTCRDHCSCVKVCEVALPGPVYDVQEVKVDGLVVNPSTYRIDNRSTLVRTGDGNCWPTCQNMTLDDGDGTWIVTYRRGQPVPESGRSALSEFACELCKACIGDDTCALPKRVTSITRQGVSFAMLDPMAFIKDRLTGLYAVDLWLTSVNPKKLSRGPAVYSPDMPRARSTTWP